MKERLQGDLKQALRSRDVVKCSTIRLLLSAIKNTEIAKMTTLDDAGIIGVIAREVKQRDESIQAFRQGNRPELVAKEETEKAILMGYLPEQVNREEIIATARRIIAEVGAKGPGDKGKVMPRIMAELRGRADGREINAIVTELLQSDGS